MINNKKNFNMASNFDRLKHIKYFSNYIAEQDMGADMPMDGEAQPAAPIEPIYTVLFIEGDKKADYTYPDGSTAKRYSTYTIKKENLDQWINTNIDEQSTGLAKSAVDVKRKAMFEYISGIKDSVTPEDKKFVEKFKNAIQSGMEGKQTQDTEVIFSPGDKVPSTDSIDVTFITIK
jgi:hypothetical protein